MAKARKRNNRAEDTYGVPVLWHIPSILGCDGDRYPSRKSAGYVNIPSRCYKDVLYSEGDNTDVERAYQGLAESLSDKLSGGVIAVSSFLAAEGKSTLSANLSHALSQLGAKVLLLECDMRMPMLARIFGLDSQVGLSDILESAVEYSDELIVRPKGYSFDLLLCGKIPSERKALIRSELMGELISYLKGKYDFIIVDTPPVSEISDALEFESVTDGYLLAAREGYSVPGDTARAASLIESAGGICLGAVILGSFG